MGSHAVELKLVPTDYEAETSRGTYHFTQYDRDWEIKFAPSGASMQGRPRVSINAMDADGYSIDWPALTVATLAATMHFQRMELGESPDVAAAYVQKHCDAAERKAG